MLKFISLSVKHYY